MLVKEKIGDRRARNYETLPKGDALALDVLQDQRVCEGCGKPVHLVPGRYGMHEFAHVDPADDLVKDNGERDHWVRAVIECRYCGAQGRDQVHYRQHAWHDAVECDRCGGEDGHAIGD